MVGQNIGKYRVIDRVGRGGMGTVYRAVDETLHREVAIKVLNTELNDPGVEKRFRAEAVTVARLNHPGIATIFELFQHEGQWLMVMEFVRGETLEALVTRKGPLPVDQASELCIQALAALAHAHSLGVVHRDLKPANLMVTEAGLVKIMDFGIARVAGSEHLTSVGFLMGTPAYMAPEQVLGQDLDARCDLYSMGVVLYHLATGKLPFKGDTPFEMAQSRIHDVPTPVRTMRDDVPAWLSEVMDLALARDPSRRFQTAASFREALRRGVQNLPLEVPETMAIPAELVATAAPRSLPILPGLSGGMPKPQSLPSEGLPNVNVVPAAQPALPVTPPGSGIVPAVPPATSGLSAPSPSPSTGPGAAGGVGTSGVPREALKAETGSTGLPAPPLAGSAPLGPTTAGGFASGIAAPASAVPAGMLDEPKPDVKPSALGTFPASGSKAGPTGPHGAHGKKASPPVALLAGAAILVLAVGGWLFSRSSSSPQASPVADASAAATPTPPPASPAEAVPAGSTAPAPTEPVAADGASAAVAGAPSATGVPPAAGVAAPNAGAATTDRGAAGRGAAPTVPGTARGGRRGSTAAANDPHLAFTDLRAIIVAGKKTDEQQVVLNFVAGQMSVVAQRGGATLATMLYKDLTKATYTRAKDPKWDPAYAAPPASADMPGGLFRSARHWLVLQSRASFMILRLNDADFRQVLEAVGTRTGINVERVASGG